MLVELDYYSMPMSFHELEHEISHTGTLVPSHDRLSYISGALTFHVKDVS